MKGKLLGFLLLTAGMYWTSTTVSAHPQCGLPGEPECKTKKPINKKKAGNSEPKKEAVPKRRQTPKKVVTPRDHLAPKTENRKVGLPPKKNNINLARKYLNDGLALLKKEEPDYSRAIVLFTKSIENKSDYPDAYYYRALANKRLGNSELAFNDYSEAIRLEPTFSDAYNNRALINVEEMDFSAAIRDYDEAVKYDPYDVGKATIYLNRGKVHQRLKNYKAALSDYDEAIKYDAQYAEAYYRKGLVGIAQKNYLDAANHCGKALAIDSKTAGVGKCIEEANDSKTKYDKRIADQKNNVNNQPPVDSYFYFGNVYLENNKFDDAIASYSESIKLSDRKAIVFLNRGTAYYSKEEYQRAIDDYGRAIDLGLNTYDVHRRKGLAHAGKKEVDAAIREYDKAIEANKECFDCYFCRSSAYIEQGMYDDAKRELTKSIDDLKVKYSDFESSRGLNSNAPSLPNPIALLVDAYLRRASLYDLMSQNATEDKAKTDDLKKKARDDRSEAKKLNQKL